LRKIQRIIFGVRWIKTWENAEYNINKIKREILSEYIATIIGNECAYMILAVNYTLENHLGALETNEMILLKS
jgi:hypothetical protein